MFGWLEDHSRFPESQWREALRVERENLGIPDNTELRQQGFSMGTQATARFFQQVDEDFIHHHQHQEIPVDIQGILTNPAGPIDLMVPIESAPPTRVPITRHDRVPLVLRSDTTVESAPPTRVPITRHDRVSLVLRSDTTAEAELRSHFSGLQRAAAEVGRPLDLWNDYDTSAAEAELLAHFGGLQRMHDQVNETGIPLSTSRPLRTPYSSFSVDHVAEITSLTEDLNDFDINEDLQECINTDVYNCPE
jgi:hypothetical protein